MFLVLKDWPAWRRLPQPKVVNGTVQKPIEGVSMVYSFTDAQAKSPHTVQYAEFVGNRGIYKDGWYALTLHRAPWESKPRTDFAHDKWELIAQGRRFGGWSLYVKDGKLKYCYNWFDRERYTLESSEALPAGKVTVKFEFNYEEERQDAVIDEGIN